MHNPFAQPYTPRQWLLSSVCWTVSSLSIWWLSTEWATSAQIDNPEAINFLSIVSYWPICLLIWWKGVKHGNMWVWLVPTNKALFKMIAGIWLAFLIVFQIVVTMLGILNTVLSYGTWCASNQVSFP